MSYIIALDQGTTSSRSLVIDDKGKIVASAQQEFTQHYPKPGWVEHDALEIHTSQIQTFTEAIKKAGIQVSEIKGIGITNQRETTVVWDRSTGQPIHHAIVWQDRRTADFCEELKSIGYAEKIKRITGLPIDAYFSATKIKWILDNVEGARAKADKGDLLFGTIDTWLIWNMTNGQSHITDQTNASRTMLFNIHTLKWDEELLQLFGIPESMLPVVVPSSSDFGAMALNDQLVPICGVAGDQQAALFGQGCLEKGEAKNTYGTGCFMLMHQGSELVYSDNGLVTTLACSLDGKAQYALEGAVFVAGAAVQWLRDGLKLIQDSSETEALANETEDDEVVIVPAFVGLGTPYWDSYARGAIFGLTRDTSKAHFAKATLQSIAFQSRDVFETMKLDAGIETKILKVDGGATANNYLMQFQADILGLEVLRSYNTESTAIGAAYLAGIQSGLWTLEEVKSFSGRGKVFTPMMETSTQDHMYKQWKKAVSRTLGWLKD